VKQVNDGVMHRFCSRLAGVVLWLLFPLEGFAVGAGDTAPDFELPAMGNELPMSLADFTGRVVYLDFWASWCGPCRKSLPLYEEMKGEFPEDRFEIVAINLDEDRYDAVRFLEKHPVSYTILLDPAGTTASQWQIQAMPSSFLLDGDGQIIKAWAGFTSSHLEEIQNEIRSSLH